MAYPPSVPPNTRADNTPLPTNHIGDHNAISDALTDIINELGSAPKGAAASLTALLDLIDPADKIIAVGGADAPPGWALCDGTAVSRATYAATFARIGTAHGVGDGSTTFNLPDLQSKFIAGKGTATWSDAVAETGGSKDAVAVTHAHNTTLAAPAHTHPVDPPTTTVDGIRGWVSRDTPSGSAQVLLPSTETGTGTTFYTGATVNISSFTSGTASATALTGSVTSAGVSGTDANLPPYMTLNYCIRLR